MPAVGDLVKPARKDGTWRLGVIERVAPDGRLEVRLYVAPPGAYEGVIHHAKAHELTVVQLEKVNGALVLARAEALSKTEFVRQVENAIAAAAKARAT